MRTLALVTLALSLTALSSAQTTRRPAPAPKPSTPKPAAPRPEAKREQAVPFTVGETLTYDVSWSGFVTAGTAVTRVTEKRASFGSTAYAVVAEGRPLPIIARLYPLYYKMDSLADSFTLLSQWSALYVEEGSRKRLASTRFDRSARKARYEIENDATAKLDLTIPASAQDGLTALYAVRARAFKAGDRVTIPVADDGALYSVEFHTTGQERVRVPFGNVEAWKVGIRILDVGGKEVGSNAGAWFSSDARRLPVKLQADLPVGNFVLQLREAR